MVTMKELYPFAPYQMYAGRHDISALLFFDLSCKIDGKEVQITNLMSAPMDEARLITSLENDYIFAKDIPLIKEKLSGLRNVIVQNSFPCDTVQFRVKKYYDAKDYIKKEGYIHEIVTGN